MIKITDEYYANCDNYNWVLCKKHIITESEAKKRKNVKAGEEEFINLTYHATLEQLLVGLLRKYSKSIAKDCNLEEYIKELKFMEKDFIDNIKNISIKEVNE